MRNIKILSVDLHNFKGFEKLHVDFNGNDAVVLGGQNGFGKTTIFDALELLFTSKIERLVNYTTLHDARGNVSQDVLPLVHDKNTDDVVRVEATIQIDDEVAKIFRQAKVADMRNPVDFSAFRYFERETENGSRPITEEEEERLGLNELASSYSFLNYLSQEEATAFLKKKEADRAKEISKLFNLEPYNIPIDQITKLLTSIRPIIRESERNIRDIESLIGQLRQQGLGNADKVVAYKKICKEDQFWDMENPNLTDNDFNSFFAEGGVMDRLLYFCQHIEDYKQYRQNSLIKDLQEEKRLSSTVFWISFKERKSLLEAYKDYRDNLLPKTNALKLENLQNFELHIPEVAKQAVQESTIDDFYKRKENLQCLYNSTTALQRDMATLLRSREELANAVSRIGHDLYSTECPLCGQKFENFEELNDKIGFHGREMQQHLSDTNKALEQQFNELRKYLQDNILAPTESFFNGQGIGIEQYNQYRNFNEAVAEKDIETLTSRLKVKIENTHASEEMRLSILQQLFHVHKDIPANINVESLHSTYNGYVRYIKPESLNEHEIRAKRDYLLTEWSKKRSQIIDVQQKKLAKEQTKHDKLKELQKNLNALKGELTTKRQNYFGKLLNDIKILFYIYSGRIMQTNYFGRDLFIKPDDSCKHIIITTSGNDANEVDALYNMSSGQLVSLTVALILSLNKLYSQSNLLAIDDPIQTIDDINLWGLIETLRHDFHDHFMLLSTHEADYGGLLSYKFRKFGINTKYVDMSKVESNR